MLRCLFVPFAVCAVLLLGACGETEVTLFDDVGAAPPLGVSYLVEGGGAHGLRSMRVTFLDLELLGGSAGGNSQGAPVRALSSPVEVELVGLSDRARLLTTRYYGPGTYTHVAVRLAANSTTATALDGQALDVAGSPVASVVLELEEPLVAAWGETVGATLVVSIDPDASLLPSLPGGGGNAYGLTPRLRVRQLQPGDSVPAEDVWGGALALSEDRRILQIGAEASPTVGDRPAALNVAITASTLLLQPDGQLAPGLGSIGSADEFADARFWVRGSFVFQGESWVPAIVATSVLLDRLEPDDPTDAAWILEGRILERRGGGQFVVRPIQFRRVGEGLNPLAGAVNSEAVEVEVDPSSLVLREDGTVGSRPDIQVGARVELQFAQFLEAPYAATRVALVAAPSHAGLLSASSLGTGVAEVNLEPGAAALDGGLVESPETPVNLSLGSSFANLSVDGGRFVRVDDLPPGVRTVAEGRVLGQANAPVIDTTELTVLPGRFEGAVTAISRADGTFTAAVIETYAPFGGETSAPPFYVALSGVSAFLGDAASAPELFDAFEALAPGEALYVRVAGIGTEIPNAVTAYEIQSRVR